MTFTIELDTGLSYLMQAALPQLVTFVGSRRRKRCAVDACG